MYNQCVSPIFLFHSKQPDNTNIKKDPYEAALQRADEQGLKVEEVNYDGNSLFSAVGRSLSQHELLRILAVTYISANKTEFVGHFNGETEDEKEKELNEYIKSISKPNVHVKKFVLKALSKVLRKPIKLYQPNDNKPLESYLPEANVQTENCITIIYKPTDPSKPNKGYYNALVKKA